MAKREVEEGDVERESREESVVAKRNGSFSLLHGT